MDLHILRDLKISRQFFIQSLVKLLSFMMRVQTFSRASLHLGF